MFLKVFLTASLVFASTLALATVPEPVILFASAQNGYATIAGRLESRPGKVVGITVNNGGIRYATMTDAEGAWGVVIKQRANSFTVTSWDMQVPEEGSEKIKASVRGRFSSTGAGSR